MVWMFASQCSWFTSMCTGLIAYICHAVPCYLWLCIYIYHIKSTQSTSTYSIYMNSIYIYIYIQCNLWTYDDWCAIAWRPIPPFLDRSFFEGRQRQALPPSAATAATETCNSLRSTWEISTLIVERHSSMTLVPSMTFPDPKIGLRENWNRKP